MISRPAAGQRCVAALPRAHAAALQAFLARHPDLEFLSGADCDPELLRWGRREYGPGFAPYYRRGDFNHDGGQDFAMVLVSEAPPRVDPALAESHRYEYQLVVVVFNGQGRGGYRPAFMKRIAAPLACLLGLTREKRPRLTFEIFETDAGFIMTPAGHGYILEHWPD